MDDSSAVASQKCSVLINLESASQFRLTPDKDSSVKELCRASRSGNIVRINEILREGISINGDDRGHMPFFESLYYHDTTVFFHFLTAGGSIFLTDCGYTLAESVALHSRWSIANKIVVLDVLAARGVSLLPLHYAALKGDAEFILAENNLEQQDGLGNNVICYLGVSGRLELLQVLYLSSPSLFSNKNKNGSTALSAAAAHNNNLPVLQFMLEKTLTAADSTDTDLQPALLVASAKGHLASVQYLVEEKGANANLSGKYPSPLTYASSCEVHALPVVQWLIEKAGANVEPSVFYAARDGCLQTFQWMVRHRGGACFGTNTTLLIWAGGCGRLDCVQWLLQEGLQSAKATNEQGRTVLLEAALKGRLHVMQWLLMNKISQLSEVDKIGTNALMMASQNGHFHVVQWLIKQGRANVLATDFAGNPALMYAIRSKYLHITKWLIQEGGASLTQRNQHGLDVIYWAAGSPALNILKWLVKDVGLDAQGSKGAFGVSPFLWAVAANHIEIVSWMLREGGSKLTETSRDNETAMMIAINEGHKELALCLVVEFNTATPSAICASSQAALDLFHNVEMFQAICLEYDLKQKLDGSGFLIGLLQHVLPNDIAHVVCEYSRRNAKEFTELLSKIFESKVPLSQRSVHPSDEEMDRRWDRSRELIRQLMHTLSHQPSDCLALRTAIEEHLNLSKSPDYDRSLQTILANLSRDI